MPAGHTGVAGGADGNALAPAPHPGEVGERRAHRQSGVLRLAAAALPAQVAAHTSVRMLSHLEVRGLGRRPAALLLVLEDRTRLEVAVAEPSRPLLVGPFLVAGLSGLPRTTREHGE